MRPPALPDHYRVIIQRHAVRTAACATLISYSCGVIVLALFPLETLTWIEVVIAALAGLAVVGLLALLIPGVRLPGEDWAFLVSGAAGLICLIGYEILSTDPAYIKWRMGLMLIAGIIGSFFAHQVKAVIEI